MKGILVAIAATIVLALFAAMTLAFQQRDILSAAVAIWPDLWFRATMLDLYCGLLIF